MEKAGVNGICLEARDRIGGRIFTVHDQESPIPIDLGAEFIHGKPRETWNIIESAPLSAYDCTENSVHIQAGKIMNRSDAWLPVDEIMSDMEEAAANGPDQSFAAFLAHGKAKDAISLYKRALAAREQALGPDHPDTLNARASLAAAYDDAGRIGDALREYQQACAGCERTFGPDHSLTLSRRAGLALSYYAAGQIGDALTELRDSTARAEQALSPADPVTRRLRQAQDDITADLAGA